MEDQPTPNSSEKLETLDSNYIPEGSNVLSAGPNPLLDIFKKMSPTDISQLGDHLQTLSKAGPSTSTATSSSVAMQVPFYRRLDFYDSPDTHRMKDLTIRKYWNDETSSWHIHWAKKNIGRNGHLLSTSNQQVCKINLQNNHIDKKL